MKITLYKYFMVFLGLFIITSYMWLRFIRERLPHDIPFTLTLISFFTLIMIIISLGFILYRLCYPKVPPQFVIEFLKQLIKILKPLGYFDALIKQNENVQKVIIQIFSFIIQKYTLYDSTRNYHLFFILNFIPKILVLIAFMFDIFILNKIQLFYYFILLNIIPLLYLYIIYTLKKQLEIYTLYLENHFYIAMISTSEDEDKEAVALFMCPVNNLKMHSEEEHDGMGGGTFKDVRFFILMQANNLIFDYKMYEYTCVETDYARKEYVKKYQPMVPVFYRYHYIPNFDEISVLLRKEFEYIIPKVVYLKAFLEVNDDITKPNFIGGRSNMLLLCGYICCWLYILLVSFHTLNILDVLEFLTSFQDYENPFTSIFEKH